MKSFLDTMKNLGKEMLYMESENTNTDREKVVEVDELGHKTITNKAGASIEYKDKKDNNIR